MKTRGDRQQETRRRILQATSDLHQEIGPARTTVAEIARRAGVQRLTVYTHFPKDLELISACQVHYFEQYPPPDLEAAHALPSAVDRVRAVLTLLYGWYRGSGEMFASVLQDRGAVPALDQVLKRSMDQIRSDLATALAAGFDRSQPGNARIRAMLLLALDFWTWRKLSGEGLDDLSCADVMTKAIAATAGDLTTA